MKTKHLDVTFWKHNLTNSEIAELVNKISKEIKKGNTGKIVSGVPYVEGITWKLW